MMIANIGDEVIYNGYIPDDIPSYKQSDLTNLIFGELYIVLQVSDHYGEMNDHYPWYKIENKGFRLWYPSISFDRMSNEYIKKKYGLR